MLFFITMIHIDNVILYYNDTYRRHVIHDTYRQCYSLYNDTMIHIDNVILYYNYI